MLGTGNLPQLSLLDSGSDHLGAMGFEFLDENTAVLNYRQNTVELQGKRHQVRVTEREPPEEVAEAAAYPSAAQGPQATTRQMTPKPEWPCPKSSVP